MSTHPSTRGLVLLAGWVAPALRDFVRHEAADYDVGASRALEMLLAEIQERRLTDRLARAKAAVERGCWSYCDAIPGGAERDPAVAVAGCEKRLAELRKTGWLR